MAIRSPKTGKEINNILFVNGINQIACALFAELGIETNADRDVLEQKFKECADLAAKIYYNTYL